MTHESKSQLTVGGTKEINEQKSKGSQMIYHSTGANLLLINLGVHDKENPIVELEVQLTYAL